MAIIRLNYPADQVYKICEPTPKLETIRKEYTSSYDGLLQWLDEERVLKNE